MKPEPLKDKILVTKFVEFESLVKLVLDNGKIQSNIHSGMNLCYTKDIKSAVEWLKEELCKRTFLDYHNKPRFCRTIDFMHIKEDDKDWRKSDEGICPNCVSINEAFEDVMK